MKAVKWKAKMETCLGLWAVYPFLRFLNFLTKFITHFLKPRACLPNSVQEPGKLPCIQLTSKVSPDPLKASPHNYLSLDSNYSQILTDSCLSLDSTCRSVLRPALRTVHPFICLLYLLSFLTFVSSLFTFFFFDRRSVSISWEHSLIWPVRVPHRTVSMFLFLSLIRC